MNSCYIRVPRRGWFVALLSGAIALADEADDLTNYLRSLEGSPADGREKINASFLQPFAGYTTTTYTTFGINAESLYDSQAKQWSVPVNLTVTQLLKMSWQTLRLQLGPRYWLDSPDNAASADCVKT